MRNRLFIEIIKANIKHTVLAITTQILFALSVTLVSYSLSIMFEAYSKDKTDFYRSITFVGVIVMITTLLSYISEYFKAKYIRKTNESLKTKITENTIEKSYSLIVTKDIGKSISWFINDADQIESQAFANFLDFIFGITIVLSAFFYILKLHWLLALTSIIFLAISLIIPRITQKYIKLSQEKYTIENEKYTESVRDNIEGLGVYFTGNALSMFHSKMKDSIALREKQYFNFSITKAKIGGVMLLASLLSQIGLVVISLYISSLGFTATGSVLSIASLAGNLFNGVQSLTGTLSTFKGAEVLLDKFQSTRVEEQHYISNLKKISIDSINLEYSENTIFEDFSFEFNKGKKYVIVGASGSGKSTLLKLILGLASPNSGQIKINEYDINEVNLEKFYQNISYIDQSIYLINGTIRDNITLGQFVSEEKMDDILNKVQLKSFIEKQPLGLDTLLESNGRSISGGEKQRIALARALVKNVDFILIDESTSQLDKEIRSSIEETILSFDNLGLIYVSHNTNTKILNRFDKIINSQSFR
ncbi:ATP-binding cassette domain-containing protein [Streptococcus himalayensis]|uniref:ABC transporter ATP-binding protein n=1 Tax=Streptococcus himalayensis TaxID=1888195 RepID=A0A917EFW8_9STRE|nr:ABC transporter ATP-binding protein [Streptococcus himalayensis]GGE30411.1 ABC transporter ATP-binding protein [Streptococcus himalayensis]